MVHIGDMSVTDAVKFGIVETNHQRTVITRNAIRHIGIKNVYDERFCSDEILPLKT